MLNLSAIVGRLWSVEPSIVALVESLLAGSVNVRELAEARADLQAMMGPGSSRSSGSVLVIPVIGMTTARGGIVACAPTVSSMALVDQLRAAAANQAVGSIVLEMDTPGGEVIGTPEAAAAVRDARSVKPVLAYAAGMMASAGYWIGSAADEVWSTVSGQVGSIGVFGMHEDVSAKLAAEGRKVTIISAGRYKAEGNPTQPLTEEGMAAAQSSVDAAYAMFVRDVARGRRVGVEDVRGGMGQGRVLPAQAAMEAGMVDRIGTLDEAVRRASALARDRSRGMAALAQAQARRVALG